EGRLPDGRFASGNRLSVGQGSKAIVRESLEGMPPEAAKKVLRLYRSMLRTLPSDGPNVRALTAARCRHAVLATIFTNEAVKAGLTTPEGLKLAECARSHDQTAQRLAVTALDIAQKEHLAKKNAPKSKTPLWMVDEKASDEPTDAESEDALQ